VSSNVKQRGNPRRALGPGPGLEKLLGELEAEIMDLLWQQDSAVTVRDVLTMINAQRARPVAYTTVMTVMTHLAEKRLLSRELVGQTYVYRVAETRDEFLQRSSQRLVNELVRDFGEVAIASFVETIRRVEPGRLEQLRRYLGPEAHES
jgi:predicted transcriptional regulator